MARKIVRKATAEVVGKFAYDKDSRKGTFHRFAISSETQGEIVGNLYLSVKKYAGKIPERIVLEKVK